MFVRCRKGQETGSVAVMGVAVVVVVCISQLLRHTCWRRVCSVLASSYGFEEAGACPPGIHAAAPTAAWSDLLHYTEYTRQEYARKEYEPPGGPRHTAQRHW